MLQNPREKNLISNLWIQNKSFPPKGCFPQSLSHSSPETQNTNLKIFVYKEKCEQFKIIFKSHFSISKCLCSTCKECFHGIRRKTNVPKAHIKTFKRSSNQSKWFLYMVIIKMIKTNRHTMLEKRSYILMPLKFPNFKIQNDSLAFSWGYC